ncbi:hypothetical protein BOB39_003434 [Escherichia coli]|nr:hypothetical protein [Escherichia coli]
MMILVTGGARSGKSRHAEGAYWGLFTGSVYRHLANP